MTVEICKEYVDLIESMNSFDEKNEDCPRGIVEEFHYHIQTCEVCVERVFYSKGVWQFSTDEGTKCERCGAPPGFFCASGCEEELCAH